MTTTNTKARDAQRDVAELIQDGAGLYEARDVLRDAIRSAAAYPVTSHLTGCELPVWLVAVEGFVRYDDTGLRDASGKRVVERMVVARFYEDRSGEPTYETPAMTAEQASAAAFRLATMADVWCHEIVEACEDACAGWRPTAYQICEALARELAS